MGGQKNQPPLPTTIAQGVSIGMREVKGAGKGMVQGISCVTKTS